MFTEWFKKSKSPAPAVTTTSFEEERYQLEAYWFAHPDGFSCDVVLREPRERTAYVGADYNLSNNIGVFGAAPIGVNGEFIDRGVLQVHGNRLVFLGQHCTRTIPLTAVACTSWYGDGSVRLNHEAGNSGVVTFQGPVRAAVCGALVSAGLLDRVVVDFV